MQWSVTVRTVDKREPPILAGSDDIALAIVKLAMSGDSPIKSIKVMPIDK